MQTALVVEDESHIRGFICTALRSEGWIVFEADSVRSGIAEARKCLPKVVLLDLGLPDGDGSEVLKAIRSWSGAPVIILSARMDEDAKILALDAGADDYLTKPFGVGELMARVRASLRRSRAIESSDQATDAVIRVGPIEIDMAARIVRKTGIEIHLTPREWSLLTILLANRGKVVTHRQLLLAVWGPSSIAQSHYTRIYMGNLRKKLEDNPARPEFLLTENAVGYRVTDKKALS